MKHTTAGYIGGIGLGLVFAWLARDLDSSTQIWLLVAWVAALIVFLGWSLWRAPISKHGQPDDEAR